MEDCNDHVPPPPSQAGGYHWLLFDADGTLFDFDRAEGAALERAFGRIGAKYEPAFLEGYRKINVELWRALEKGEITPALLKVRRFERLFEEIGLEQDAAMFGTVYLECLAACPDLIAGAAEMIELLARRYRIAIITNGLQVVQRGRFERCVIRPHISELIISEEIGCAKPAREFFDVTFARLGHPARSEVLLIGDNWTSDVRGGVAYGIPTCWYNPGRLERPEPLELALEIQALSELLVWLNGREKTPQQFSVCGPETEARASCP